MTIIPMWVVTFPSPSTHTTVSLRVPDTDMDSILRVLRMSGVTKFEVIQDS